MPRPARLVAFFFLALGALALPTCNQVLNTDGVQIVRAPDAPVAVAVDAGVLCDPDELRCEGAALQVCKADQSGFRTARICSSAELCCADASACDGRPGCRAPACAPGDFRCAGARLEICNDGQTGWTRVDTCASELQCNASLGRCTDQPCDFSTTSFQCNGTELQSCQALGWRFEQDCSTPSLCSADPGSPGCARSGCSSSPSSGPSPFRCDNGNLQRCNDGQTAFEYVETCLNAVSCNALLGVDADPFAPYLALDELRTLGCQQPLCSPGTYRCEGARLLRCNANRTLYEIEEGDCGTAGRCNASEGRCELATCEEGARQCSGNEWQICTRQGTWERQQTCPSAALCEPTSGCVKAECAVSDYRCTDQVLERCNINGDGWIPVHDCESRELCNHAAKRCDPPVCTEGERRCNRDAQLQVCAPGRAGWQLLLDCPALAQPGLDPGSELVSGLCDLSGGGQCQTVPTCEANGLRCNGQFLEKCRDGAWRPQERCETAALCDATLGACATPGCDPGSYRCAVPGTDAAADPLAPRLGLELQICNEAGAYTRARLCSGEELCDERRGQCDLCESYREVCFGDALYRCSADGQERELEKTCTAGCVIVPSGADADAAAQPRAVCLEDVSRSTDSQN
jgi:hypothetical protein